MDRNAADKAWGRRRRGGWTLTEALLVMALVAMLFAAAAPLLQQAAVSYGASDPRIEMLQRGRAALSLVTRALRTSRGVVDFVDGGGGDVILDFEAADGSMLTLERIPPESRVAYGPLGDAATLVENCSGLSVTCYGADGSSVGSAIDNASVIHSVRLELSLSDPGGRFDPLTLVSRAALERPRPTVVINEVMYKPSGELGSKDKNQWVELYNATDAAVDVGGWRLWTKDQDHPDTLSGDAVYSTGSTVIPAGGYAVVTDTDSELYREELKNGDFERGDIDDWREDWGWFRYYMDPVSKTYLAACQQTGWARMYQDFKIDKDAVGTVRLLVREMHHPYYPSPTILIRVTNRGSTTFVTVYDGPCHGEWTAHEADLTAYKDVDARLEIWSYRPSDSYAWVRVDAAAIYWSRNPNLPADCLHLWVDDDKIGDNLEEEQVFLGPAGTMGDAAVFETAWGGNDDGSTLSRTSATAPGTEAETWYPGPWAGTPGQANDAAAD